MYRSVRAARSGGHRDLLVPPTFLFGLTLRTSSPFSWATERGFDMTRALHGEQRFDYRSPVYAGDRLQLLSTCSAVRRAGRHQLLERQTEVSRGGAVVAVAVTTLVLPDAGDP